MGLKMNRHRPAPQISPASLKKNPHLESLNNQAEH